MPSKDNSATARTPEAPAEVFRQFAWHLAGSLAAAGSSQPATRPGKATAKRG